MSGRLLPMTRAELENLAIKRDFDPAQMAESQGISLRELERYFAGNLGTTPLDFARELQCRLAKEHLRDGKLSNKEIAKKVKFADEFRFCHVFKKYCGVSPKVFAAQSRRDGGSNPPKQ
jgi:AraC-like DNA-binding protein